MDATNPTSPHAPDSTSAQPPREIEERGHSTWRWNFYKWKPSDWAMRFNSEHPHFMGPVHIHVPDDAPEILMAPDGEQWEDIKNGW